MTAAGDFTLNTPTKDHLSYGLQGCSSEQSMHQWDRLPEERSGWCLVGSMWLSEWG